MKYISMQICLNYNLKAKNDWINFQYWMNPIVLSSPTQANKRKSLVQAYPNAWTLEEPPK